MMPAPALAADRGPRQRQRLDHRDAVADQGGEDAGELRREILVAKPEAGNVPAAALDQRAARLGSKQDGTGPPGRGSGSRARSRPCRVTAADSASTARVRAGNLASCPAKIGSNCGTTSTSTSAKRDQGRDQHRGRIGQRGDQGPAGRGGSGQPLGERGQRLAEPARPLGRADHSDHIAGKGRLLLEREGQALAAANAGKHLGEHVALGWRAATARAADRGSGRSAGRRGSGWRAGSGSATARRSRASARRRSAG